MFNHSKGQTNKMEEGARNNSEEAALLKAEDKIKSLKNNNVPAAENFQRNLLEKLLAARQKHSMKFWQMKLLVPAAAFAFVLAFALGAIYFKADGNLAASGQKKIAAVWQAISGKKSPSGGQLAAADQKNPAEQNSTGNSGEEKPAEGSGLKTTYDKPLAFGLVKIAFAQSSENNISVKAILSGEKTALDSLSNLKNFENSAFKFSAAQKQALIDSNFFLAENKIIAAQNAGTDDFTDTYSSLKGSDSIYYREPQNAVFITSDLGLHLYHLLIDRSFQKLEETKMQPALREMTQVLFADSINNYNQASDPVLKDSYKRLAVYYLVPLIILDAGGGSVNGQELRPENFSTYAEFLDAQTKQQEALSSSDLDFSLTEKKYGGFDLSDEIYDTAAAELSLIKDAQKAAPSPLFTPLRQNFINDYTQFTPRSHYTKNNILKSYFMSMMWYGRMGFTLNSPALTRDALLITGQVNSLQLSGGSVAKKWADMMDVIDFFVGESDDLTPYQYTQEMKAVYGSGITPQEAIKEENLQKFIDGVIKDLPSPRILSEILDITGRDVSKEKLLKETLQFRFMGQRFTPDAYVLNKLTQGGETPDKETGQRLPSMPTALEPISVIAPDNQTVKNYLDSWVRNNAPASDKIIAKISSQLKNEFSQYDSKTWTQNIYWGWLDSFRSLLGGYGQGYPFFMKNDAWQKKNLGTVLGSYTELKHDTLLYSKQSYAERGGGGNEGELPAVPKGYVEPDVVFWNKLSNLAKLTRDGLKNRKMFPEQFDYKYETFIEDVGFLQDIASQELQNKKISDNDFEKLRLISNSLAAIAEALPGEELTKKEMRAGIVADIHTDAVSGLILYEATGKPNLIYTAVQDINGARLTVGAVYNHYEFSAPLEKRLADEDWQEKVYENAGPLPAEDLWTAEIKK